MRGVTIMGTSNLSQREAYRIMLKDYPDVMNAEQVCEVLGVGMKTCYRILKEGKITSIKVGRAYRIPKAHLLSYLVIGIDNNGSTSSYSNLTKAIMQTQVDSNGVREE